MWSFLADFLLLVGCIVLFIIGVLGDFSFGIDIWIALISDLLRGFAITTLALFLLVIGLVLFSFFLKLLFILLVLTLTVLARIFSGLLLRLDLTIVLIVNGTTLLFLVVVHLLMSALQVAIDKYIALFCSAISCLSLEIDLLRGLVLIQSVIYSKSVWVVLVASTRVVILRWLAVLLRVLVHHLLFLLLLVTLQGVWIGFLIAASLVTLSARGITLVIRGLTALMVRLLLLLLMHTLVLHLLGGLLILLILLLVGHLETEAARRVLILHSELFLQLARRVLSSGAKRILNASIVLLTSLRIVVCIFHVRVTISELRPGLHRPKRFSINFFIHSEVRPLHSCV